MATRAASAERVQRAPSAARFGGAIILVVTSCGIIGCGNGQRGDDGFKEIRAAVTRGRYADAIPRLERYLANRPRRPNASRAGLFLGKCHLALGRFQEAAQAFETTIAEHRRSPEAHKCRYKLAVLALVQGEREDAIRRFGALADQPDGPLAPEAAAMHRYLTATPKTSRGRSPL
ncbi:MAG: hypothetical protein CMJ18_13275 [Phycisphaeraceae bacterium]|nr:hypothetical protein [Phycisphaeraceae bacterium]